MQPLSGNQRPNLLTALMNMSLVLRLPRKMHLCRSSSNAPRLPSFLEILQCPHVLLSVTRCRIPSTCHTKRWCFCSILTSKCASRHNGVHFFNITTSKNGPNVWCFLHILTLTCALCHNGCIFSTSKLPKAVRRKPNPKATNQKPSGHADGKF